MKKPKPKHGGKRKGAGRKRAYSEETVVASFRVPKSKKHEIKAIVNKKLASYCINHI